jgi:hypothetical protein
MGKIMDAGINKARGIEAVWYVLLGMIFLVGGSQIAMAETTTLNHLLNRSCSAIRNPM